MTITGVKGAGAGRHMLLIRAIGRAVFGEYAKHIWNAPSRLVGYFSPRRLFSPVAWPASNRPYMIGHYHARNLRVARTWIAQIKPRRVVEIAAGDPDMAWCVMRHVPGVVRYEVSDIDAPLVEFMRGYLRPYTQVTAREIDGNSDRARYMAGDCDLLLCPSLEHFTGDRELIAAATQGTQIIFGAPVFGYQDGTDCHLRRFLSIDDITRRYDLLLRVRDIYWHARGMRWVVWAERRSV